jgi:hypothetical protein
MGYLDNESEAPRDVNEALRSNVHVLSGVMGCLLGLDLAVHPDQVRSVQVDAAHREDEAGDGDAKRFGI